MECNDDGDALFSLGAAPAFDATTIRRNGLCPFYGVGSYNVIVLCTFPGEPPTREGDVGTTKNLGSTQGGTGAVASTTDNDDGDDDEAKTEAENETNASDWI
jgi:hypothetical protein